MDLRVLNIIAEYLPFLAHCAISTNRCRADDANPNRSGPRMSFTLNADLSFFLFKNNSTVRAAIGVSRYLAIAVVTAPRLTYEQVFTTFAATRCPSCVFAATAWTVCHGVFKRPSDWHP